MKRSDTIKIETHVHTRYSKDSLLGLWCLYFMCRLKKIDVIAITDHNTIRGGQEFARRFDSLSPHKYRFVRGINVIIGSEVMTDGGEIIGLFLKEEVEKGLSVKDTIAAIKKQGGLVYLPHPYDKKRQKTVVSEKEIELCVDMIDCCECYNGRNVSKEYEQQQDRIASKFAFAKVVGSDAHTFFEIGRNYMISSKIMSVQTKENFLDVIEGCEFYKKDCLSLAHHMTKIAKALKLIKGGNINEVYRAFTKKIRR